MPSIWTPALLEVAAGDADTIGANGHAATQRLAMVVRMEVAHVSLFIAGTDGSGHHFWRRALSICPFCKDATQIHQGVYDLWYTHKDKQLAASRIINHCV